MSYNYAVVQTQWIHDWEQVNWDPVQVYPYSIQNAACLPATFLHFVRYNLNSPVMYTTGGMCAQGASAGSGALGYSLAWCGAGDVNAGYIDKVELISGPVFSDIAQGCYVPQPPNTVPPVDICGGANSPAWCVGWPGGGLSELPSYVGGDQYAVGSWTGDSSCRGSSPTSQTSYNNWLSQSIVNGPNGGGGSFYYPKTLMQAWLCASDTEGTYNNSAPEGFLFYQQVGNAVGLPIDFQETAVTNCSTVEGVTDGMIMAGPYNGDKGMEAIAYDMADPVNTKTQVCHKISGH